MKRVVAFSLIVAAACGGGVLDAQDRRGGGPGGGPGVNAQPGQSYANPSAAIAAELAMAKVGRERGLWSALAASAAPDAILFAPGMVWAQMWLKGRQAPPAPWTREPHAVWSSCDGSLVVSQGAWAREGKGGRFVTIWQRQPDGGYRWVVEESMSLTAPPPAPEMIAALVADCPERARRPDGPPPGAGGKPRKPEKAPEKPKEIKLKDLPPLDPAGRSGSAGDGSLRWAVKVDPAGTRRITAFWKRDGGDVAIVDETLGPG